MADLWHYTRAGKQMEPVTPAELRRLAATGGLRPTDMVWKEGMANWVKASAIKQLFPPGSASAITSEAPAAAPRSSLTDVPADEPRRRSRRRAEVEDEDVEDAEDERPRKRKKAKSSNLGLILGLVGGGGVVLVLIIGVIAFIAFNRGPSGPLGNYSYTVSLRPSNAQSRTFDFKADTQYELKVTSTGPTDVDLHVKNKAGGIVAMDESIGPNSQLRWTPPHAGPYTLEVRNLDRGRANSSTVSIREIGPGQAIGNPIILPQFGKKMVVPLPRK